MAAMEQHQIEPFNIPHIIVKYREERYGSSTTILNFCNQDFELLKFCCVHKGV